MSAAVFLRDNSSELFGPWLNFSGTPLIVALGSKRSPFATLHILPVAPPQNRPGKAKRVAESRFTDWFELVREDSEREPAVHRPNTAGKRTNLELPRLGEPARACAAIDGKCFHRYSKAFARMAKDSGATVC